MVWGKKVRYLFLFGLVFLVACTTQTTTTGVEGAYQCYAGETQMVTAAFADFAPESSETSPYEIGEEIPIEVVLTNFFSDDIDAGNAKVLLTGEAGTADIFSGTKSGTAETLYAIDPETCLTEQTEVILGPLTYQVSETTKITKEITGLYCYTEPVVVKAFLYFTDDAEEIGTTLPDGSNPPSSVQVTAIEQDTVDIDPGEKEGDMRFKVTVNNIGEGTIVPSLDDCFAYRDASYREELTLAVDGPYTIECPSTVKLGRGEKFDVVTCTVTGISSTNIGAQPIGITITLSGFAYEDTIPPTTIWIEP